MCTIKSRQQLASGCMPAVVIKTNFSFLKLSNLIKENEKKKTILKTLKFNIYIMF